MYKERLRKCKKEAKIGDKTKRLKETKKHNKKYTKEKQTTKKIH